MRKLTTLALTGAMVAAMSCTAFADGLMSKTGNDAGAEIYSVDVESLTADQLSAIATITADVTVTSGFVNGCIGGNVDGKWASGNCEISDTAGTFSWTPAGSLAGDEPHIEVQFWWVNPVYDEDGNETGEAGTATLTALHLLDANGVDVRDAAPSGDADASGDAGAGDSDASGDVAPVAYLAAIVAVAGLAMVASKKRA